MKASRNRFGCLSVFATIAMGLLANFVYADDAKTSLPPNVVARQGGVDVTLQDVDAAAAKIPEGDRAGYFDSPKRIESIVGSLLYQKQLAVKARAEKDWTKIHSCNVKSRKRPMTSCARPTGPLPQKPEVA